MAKVTANLLAGPGLDRWLSRIPVSGSPAYHLTDALGSTVGLADPTGAVATSYTYEPFGRTAVSGTSSTNPFRFTGREEDSTGALTLYHYRARYYSPTLQRFLTEDPIGFAGGDANLYGYVGNAPTVQHDPFGLIPPPGAEVMDIVIGDEADPTAGNEDRLGCPPPRISGDCAFADLLVALELGELLNLIGESYRHCTTPGCRRGLELLGGATISVGFCYFLDRFYDDSCIPSGDSSDEARDEQEGVGHIPPPPGGFPSFGG